MIRQKSLHIILLGSFVLLSGCTKELSVIHEPGSTILFGAATYWQSDALTKTEYSGELLSSNTVERINWVPDYDRIRIYSPQATLAGSSAGASSDYNILNIQDVTNRTGVRESQANITATGGNGLDWGTSWPHYFFAMYPAAGMTSEHGATVSSSDAVLAAGSGNAATVTGRVPKNQTVYKTVSGSVVEYKADMNHAYMYDVEKVEQGSTGNVKLSFKPLVTAFEITMRGVSGDLIDSPLTTLTLSSSQEDGHYLAGKFTTTLGYGSTGATFSAPSIASDSNRSNEITVSLPDPVKLTTDKTVKVTILALPVDQGLLKLTLTFDNGQTRTLEFRESGSFITVSACKKVYVRNLGVPGTAWDYYLTDPSTDEISIHGIAAASGTATITSYKQNAAGTQVGENLTYEYAEANADGSCMNNWSTTKQSSLSWLTSVSASTGTTKTLTVNVAARTSGEKTTVSEQSMHTARLKENGPYGSSSSYFDLSMWDFETGETRSGPVTANCYVVDGPGYFMLPLIYGNAIDYTKAGKTLYSNGVNQYAYKNAASASASPNGDVWNLLYNAKGGAINDPFVVYQTFGSDFSSEGDKDNWSTTTLRSHVHTKIEWQDVSGLVSNLSVEMVDCGTSSPFFHPNGTRVQSVPYLKFQVNSSTIKQGNAVISVTRDLNASGWQAMWSWHIWVTDGVDTDGDIKGDGLAPIELRTRPGHSPTPAHTSNWVMPVNLGWYDRETLNLYPEKCCYIRVRQEHGYEDPVVFKVVREQYYTKQSKNNSRCVMYQWGRKDPFPPKNATTAESNATTTSGIAWTIWYPTNFYVEHTVDGVSYTWAGKQHPKNLWNMNIKQASDYADNKDVAVAKTIYDPCPPGYCVPHRYAFTNFITNNISTNVDVNDETYASYNSSGVIFKGSFDRFNAADWDGDGALTRDDYNALGGFWFYAGEKGNSPTLFFPASGYILQTDGTYGAIGNNGYYWLSAPESGTNNGRSIVVSDNYTNSSEGIHGEERYAVSHRFPYNRSMGNTIRAVKEH